MLFRILSQFTLFHISDFSIHKNELFSPLIVTESIVLRKLSHTDTSIFFQNIHINLLWSQKSLLLLLEFLLLFVQRVWFFDKDNCSILHMLQTFYNSWLKLVISEIFECEISKYKVNIYFWKFNFI